MTDFQREIACFVVLLSFLFGCFCFAEIAHTEATETVTARVINVNL